MRNINFFIYLIITKIWELFRKSHISHWFKMSCLTCLVFSCVFCFFLKRWHYIKIFVLHEKAVHLLKCFLTDWQQTSQKVRMRKNNSISHNLDKWFIIRKINILLRVGKTYILMYKFHDRHFSFIVYIFFKCKIFYLIF